jgi:glycerol-3-phosphate dehydrogenase
MVLPSGAAAVLPRVRAMCQGELGWSDARWHSEEEAYRALWVSAHGLP